MNLSPRLQAIVDALPLYPGNRVLEIGCGPGAAARAVAGRIGDGHILAIDRSARAIHQAVSSSLGGIASGRLSFLQVAIEDFTLDTGEQPCDLAFAIRIGILDGCHPQLEQRALYCIANALTNNGKPFIVIHLDPYRERK